MFDVYVDGAMGTSREAVRALAMAMAARYGIPEYELEARLVLGRFRVKARVDRATAEAYLRELAGMGARVRLEPAETPATASDAASPAHLGARNGVLPARATASRPATHPTLPAQRDSRTMRSALPPAVPSTLPPVPAESRTARSGLPPQGARNRGPTLPPAPAESRTARSVLPAPAESRPVRSVLPSQPESRPMASALPTQAESRPASSPLPPPRQARPAPSALPAARPALSPQRPAAPPVPAGPLAAASSGAVPTVLGALERSGALSLATLDDEPAPAPLSDGTLPASMGPAALPSSRPVRARHEPLDPFAPPEPSTTESLLQLAEDDRPDPRARAGLPAGEPARRSAPAASSAGALAGSASPTAPVGQPGWRPPAAVGPAQPAPEPRPRASTPRIRADAAPARGPATGLGANLAGALPSSPRARLVAGVALAIVLGFVPAHLVAGMRERSAFRAIDARIAAVQAAADTPESYAALDDFRASQLEAKRSAHRAIALTSLLIWAAAGSGLAYAWFRRLPWASRTSDQGDPRST